MKITTTIEVTKQEKNILHSALQAYKEYLNKMVLEKDYQDSEFAKKIINETVIETNKLLEVLEQNI